MHRELLLRGLWISLAFLAVMGCRAVNPLEEHPVRLSAVWERFDDPPAAFRPAPLYVWNDDMQREELARQIRGFKQCGYGGVFVHPRPGLVTPYLSEAWLDLWRFTLEECRKQGMVAHLYDENSYPSGFAGGHVPEAMPSSRQVIIRRETLYREEAFDFQPGPDTIALYRLEGFGAPGQVRLTVDPDGKGGSLSIGGMGAPTFRYHGAPFTGTVAFRAIVGRNLKVDDVKLYQVDAEGEMAIVFEDDFNRETLGEGWIKESLTPGADGSALKARIDEGVLILEHDGTMNDTWLRPDCAASFEGKTTVFEFTLVERFGQTHCNPSLALGARPFEAGKTSGVMLIDTNGAGGDFNHGMVDGEWVSGRAGPGDPTDAYGGVTFERVPLPAAAEGAAEEAGEGTGEEALEEAAEGETARTVHLEPGTYLHCFMDYGGKSAWLGGRFYVDLLRPGVGDAFLDITLGAYDGILEEEYGESVLSCFTDEPHISGSWTPGLPAAFQERFGYDLLDHLPSLYMEAGAWQQVRHDYSAALLQLFIEHFAKPYYEACAQRGIAATGHVWEHGWPNVSHGSDVMAFNAWQHAPGIDCLMNRYSEGPNAQFGNYRAAAEVRSITNQLGRVRTLCEAYGASGWEVNFEDLKRIGDWLMVGGINLFNPHLSFYTIRGARKADHPPSFSYHEPWWEAYRMLNDYTGRICWALSAGEECNRILVIEPTSTMWMYNWSPTSRPRLQKLGILFQQYITELAAAGVAFDLGSEPVMADRGRVKGGRLYVGERGYDTILLPPGLENLEASTVDLLMAFAEGGGRILTCVGTPAYVEGLESDAAQAVAEQAGLWWREVSDSPSEILEAFWFDPAVQIAATAPEGGRVFHLVRKFRDGYLLFAVNTSLDGEATVEAKGPGFHVHEWCAATGEAFSVPVSGIYAPHDGGDPYVLRWSFTLPPAGSRLFAMGRSLDSSSQDMKTADLMAGDLKTSSRGPRKVLDALGGLEITLLGSNVLPLDFMDLELEGEVQAGEVYRGLYRYDAQQRIYKAHGFDKNPWDRAVQFEDEILLQDSFPADSGFTLHYPFVLEGFDTMPELELVVERGDRYAVSVNGHPLQAEEGTWWLDHSFNVYRMAPELLRAGKNTVTTAASPFTLHHEPEPVYVLGDFVLESAEKGWVLEPPEPLTLGAWSDQGRPCYAGGVAYTTKVRCMPVEKKRYFVELPDWSGVVARVDVNGKRAGYIGWQPFELEVTDRLRYGENDVTVVVFGSLKNLLGPHHRGKVRGSAWPGHFLHGMETQPPGDRYDVIGYGLNEPFRVAEE